MVLGITAGEMTRRALIGVDLEGAEEPRPSVVRGRDTRVTREVIFRNGHWTMKTTGPEPWPPEEPSTLPENLELLRQNHLLPPHLPGCLRLGKTVCSVSKLFESKLFKIV